MKSAMMTTACVIGALVGCGPVSGPDLTCEERGGEYVCWDQPGGGERCVCEIDDRAEEEPGAEPAYEPQPQPWHPATVPILPQQVKVKVTR